MIMLRSGYNGDNDLIMIIDPNDNITGDNDQNPSETGSFWSKMFRAGVTL